MSEMKSKNRPRITDVDDCVVVGVGASAGGLDAYTRLLQHMPATPGVALVLVQHLDPSHESPMVELLSRHTDMRVVQAAEGMRIEADHVYMIPPNHFLRMDEGSLHLDEAVTTRGVRLPIDYFFRSLAKDRKERAISVVLSGTGSDGAEGTRVVKAEGGMTIAEKPDQAGYDGMPLAAVATGVVDHVLPIAGMGEVITSYARHPYVSTNGGTLATRAPDHFRAILSVLRAHTDQDFSRYKHGTLTRRIERRMGVRHIDDPEDYLALLRAEPDEVQGLFRDLLIGVTRFFRSPEAWVELERAIEARLSRKPPGETLRVWVPGCSSGEEAYSLAILLFEIEERMDRRFDLQIFATDIDVAAIESARKGLYPAGAVEDLDPSRVEMFFHREGEGVHVRKRLRETCIFAVQNLLADPPFSHLDLISCRNVLIYLEPDIQGRVFDMFHFALAQGGILFLGSSESPGKRTKLYDTLSSPARIYRKRGRSPARGVLPLSPREGGEAVPSVPERRTRVPGPMELAKTALLEAYAPASVVVDDRGLIQYFQGPVRDYLDFPSGEPVLDLASMVRYGLKSRVRQVLRRLRESEDVVEVVAPRAQRGDGLVRVRIDGRTLGSRGGPPLYLVSFLDEARPMIAPEDGVPAGEGAERTLLAEGERAEELARELQATREDLQGTIEELESSNEELKASNEEVISMNEELQSTNEELQTSREELQSLNEELSTVNSQLHEKVTELEDATDDLVNFLASTDIATLFLDGDLRIRRFTPATTRVLNVRERDVGRPVHELASAVEDGEMVADARQVLSTLIPTHRPAEGPDGRRYIRRVTPFRTTEDQIKGVVVTYTDVTELRAATDRLRARGRQQAATALIGRMALSETPLEVVMEEAVRLVSEAFDVSHVGILKLDESEGALRLIGGHGWDDERLGTATVPLGSGSQAGFALTLNEPVITSDVAEERRFEPSPLWVGAGIGSGLSVLIGPGTAPWGALGVHRTNASEFTEDDANAVGAIAHVLWESIRRTDQDGTVRRQLAEIDSIYDSAPIGLCFMDRHLRYVRINETLAEINGKSVEAHLGNQAFEIVPQYRETLGPILNRILDSGEPQRGLTVEGRNSQGEERSWLVSYVPVEVDGQIQGINSAVTDITRLRRMERELQTARERAEAANEAKSHFLANMSHEIRSPLAAILGFTELLDEMVTADKARSMLASIRGSGVHLRQLLDDILDLAKVEAGKIHPSSEKVAVPRLLAQIRSFMGVRAAEAGLTLSIDAQGPIPESIQSDERVLRQILLNLVANAIKFTQQGGVLIHIDLDAEGGWMHFDVIDSGVGIHESDLDRIFLPFEQALLQERFDVPSTGLGLAISRKLAEALGGRLGVESEFGSGSTFRLSAPVGPLDDVPLVDLEEAMSGFDPTTVPPRIDDLRGRVLVAEDRSDLQHFVRELLERAGCEVVIASDGAHAIELARVSNDFDAILMDIRMPLVDGLTASRRIREGGYTGPIIALTAGVMDEDRQRALRAGCDDFIPKPIDSAILLGRLADYLETKSTQKGGKVPRRQVLLIEDHADSAAVTRIWLESRGHRVRWAASGRAAFEAVSEELPEVLIMDHGLPDLSGGELLRRLREEEGLEDALAICLTGEAEASVDWQTAGFDAFLQKPFDFDDLERLLDGGSPEDG